MRASILLLSLAGACHASSPVTCTIGGEEHKLHATAGNSASPTLVSRDGGVLAIWEENDGAAAGAVVAQPLDEAGEAAGDVVEVGPVDAWGAQPQALAFSDVVVLVWVRGGGAGCGPIVARTLAPDGAPRGEIFELAGSGAAACDAPAIAWRGDQVLVAWVDESEEDETLLHLTPLDPATGWGASVALTSGGGASAPRLLSREGETLVVWTDFGEGTPGVWSATLDARGQAVRAPSVLLDDTSVRYAEPTHASPSDEAVLVWDARPEGGDARLWRAVLDGDALRNREAFSDGRGSVNDVSNVTPGPLHAAAWIDDRGLQAYASVSDADGNRASGDRFGLQPAIQAVAGGFLALWRDTRDHPGGDLYTRRIDCAE